MKKLCQRLFCEEEGQDIIEYAFLAAFISVVAYTIVVTIGEDVTSIYTSTQGTTSTAATAAGS